MKNAVTPLNHIGIVASRFNEKIVNGLLRGALNTLHWHGYDDSSIHAVHVPGAFELPIAAKRMIEVYQPAAILTLGAVIRGETAHFDFISAECMRGIAQVGLDSGVPVIFGVLTTETVAQAIARSDDNNRNKGVECAEAAVKMIALFETMKRSKA